MSGQPTGSSTQLEEVGIDFRVSGLPHAVVKQAENSRVRELVKKIENHPHRQDLEADLQQSNAYNPTSEKSKKMIQDMVNVELFELCATIPEVQCSECLLHWNQGIVCCICGHLLRENQSSRNILRWTWDLLSIPNYVIKKVRPHGNRHGKTEEQRQHHIAHNLRKRCIKRVVLKEFTIVSRTIQHFVSRYSALIELKKYASRWTRTRRKVSPIVCRKTSTLDTKKNWWISLNTSGRNEPMKLRSDFNNALTKLHRLHRESGEERLAPIPSWQYQKWHPSSSSSSTSWWQWKDSWWSS